MPCDFMRPLALNFGLAVALAAAYAAGLAGAPPQDESPTSQQQPGWNAIDRWNRMSPEERERELAKLPPERAQRIRQRLKWYNQLPPDQKEELRENYRRFAALPPEKQEIVRQRMREFRSLPRERRLAIRQEMQALRKLPEDARRVRIDSELFRSQFSPQEQQILRDITGYLAPQK